MLRSTMTAIASGTVAAATAAEVSARIARYMLADAFPIVLDIEKSEGSYLHDAISGRRLLDCYSFIASNPLGYNHPKLHDAQFEHKLLRAARHKVANSDLHTPELAEFVETFARIAMPPPFKHLFFIEGGAQAVENALKTAFDWKVRRNLRSGGEERGGQILHFREAFHGRSGYALSLTNTDPKKTKYFPKFDWPRIPNPKIRFPQNELHEAEARVAEERSLDLIERAFYERRDDIAAIIIEPIQGEGGDNHFRPSFHQELRAAADRHEALLIYDEVQTGLGLSGKLWAYQHYGITPDIVVFGKKTQVCGIMAGPRVDEVENNVFAETSRINSTWGGSLADMVRCQRYLEIIQEEDLTANAASVGNELLGALESLERAYPTLLSNARGKGLMCAIDLPSAAARTATIRAMLELGALALPCGERTLRLRPALTFNSRDVAKLRAILQAAIEVLI